MKLGFSRRVLNWFKALIHSRRFSESWMGKNLSMIQLMELHGGHFALDSELGKGTTACLLFPAERSLRCIGQSVAAR